MKKFISKIKFHTKHILKHPNGFKLAIGYFLLLFRLNHFFKIKRDNYKIYFSKNVLALNCFVDKYSRVEDEMIIKSILKKGDTYVDVGANIGTLCLSSSKNIKDLSIYAFEANPITFKSLERNFKLNNLDTMSLYQIALGEDDKEIVFSNIGSDDQNKVINDIVVINKNIHVQMKKLDHVFVLPMISLLKIDVEGYELFVLEGALKNLKNCSSVYFEYSPINTAKYNYHPIDVINLLIAFNFSIFLPSLNRGKLNLDIFDVEHQNLELNLLAINKSHNKYGYKFSSD